MTTFDENATCQADKFVKGARCYIEGSVKLEQWAGHDGVIRHGLGCLSWHCRLAEIGRNKPRRARPRRPDQHGAAVAPPPDLNDMIPFAPEWR